MSGEEFVLAIMALVMGSVVLIVGITKITGLIKSWINRNQHMYDDETFNRLAKAFTQYKKDTERRLQNLEAIVTDDERNPTAEKELDKPHKTIEIEENNTKEQKSESGRNSNLKNMLRE